MARVLIVENDPALARLLGLQVAHLGHEPVLRPPTAELPNEFVDAAVIDPADAASLAFAWRIRKERPRVRLVLASVLPRSEATAQLRPDAYLVKPFGLAELDRALSAD